MAGEEERGKKGDGRKVCKDAEKDEDEDEDRDEGSSLLSRLLDADGCEERA